MTEDLERQGE